MDEMNVAQEFMSELATCIQRAGDCATKHLGSRMKEVPQLQVVLGQLQLHLQEVMLWGGQGANMVMMTTPAGQEAVVENAIAKGNVIELPVK